MVSTWPMRKLSGLGIVLMAMMLATLTPYRAAICLRMSPR
jgi:hypothetical protein